MHRRLFASLLVAALVACGGSSSEKAAPTTAPASASASSDAAVSPTRTVSFTRRDVVVEDTTRITPAEAARGLVEKPTRTLPVMLLVPDGPGPFPLLEFSHGVGGTGPAYVGLLEQVAAAGYVVAAPTFPLSSGPTGTIFDMRNQPADVYFVVDSVLKMATDPADPLYNRVRSDHIAIAGHSLGAMTTYGAVFNSCCTQARVAAAIVLAGVEAPFDNGNYDVRPPIPVLFVHGAADKTLKIDGGGDKLFPLATGPAGYLRYPDGTHSGIFANADGKLTAQAMVAWLDKWLRNDPAGLEKLPDAVTASGLATFQTRGL